MSRWWKQFEGVLFSVVFRVTEDLLVRRVLLGNVEMRLLCVMKQLINQEIYYILCISENGLIERSCMIPSTRKESYGSACFRLL